MKRGFLINFQKLSKNRVFRAVKKYFFCNAQNTPKICHSKPAFPSAKGATSYQPAGNAPGNASPKNKGLKARPIGYNGTPAIAPEPEAFEMPFGYINIKNCPLCGLRPHQSNPSSSQCRLGWPDCSSLSIFEEAVLPDRSSLTFD